MYVCTLGEVSEGSGGLRGLPAGRVFGVRGELRLAVGY